MTERRGFIIAVGVALAAIPRTLHAQPRKSARIGWVGSWYSQSVGALLFDSFRQGMRELGYVEGQNLTIEARWLEGTASPHEEAAKATAELVRSKADVLVAQGTTIPGAKDAAGSTPVVFVYSGDPVEAKFVASLARPGGNLTGMTVFDVELGGKQLELLKEAIPRLSRVGVLANPGHIGEYPELQRSQTVAQRLGLRLQQALVRTIPEVNAALETMRRERVQALMVFPNLLTLSQRHVIADVAANHRIPTISGWEDFAVDGNFLMTYGPSLLEAWRYAATYVDKILKGARPADLPVEQPTRLHFVINLKAAKALGVTIPASLLARADRILE